MIRGVERFLSTPFLLVIIPVNQNKRKLRNDHLRLFIPHTNNCNTIFIITLLVFEK